VALQLGDAGEPVFGPGISWQVAVLSSPFRYFAPSARGLGQHPTELRAVPQLVEHSQSPCFVHAVGPELKRPLCSVGSVTVRMDHTCMLGSR
jgi:hypothetical protein